MSFSNNDKAVSPVVATLVLIVVAIIGAAAVGALLGMFSNNVGSQANAENTGAASSTTLSVVGSTTVQPFSELAAKSYEASHQGIQINIQGGGSGAGVTAVGQKVADIGSTSRAIKDTEITTYPTLKTYEIGACAAVFIANAKLTTLTSVTQYDLARVFNGSSTMLGSVNVSAHGRSDSSGTKDTVLSWLGAPNGKAQTQGSILQSSGSQTLENDIASDDTGVGYVDYGFAVNDPKVKILDLVTCTHDVINRKVLGSGGVAVAANTSLTFSPGADGANILTELKTDGTKAGTKYPEGLIQPMFYITNGEPTAIQKDYIKFAQSPDGDALMKKCYYFGITEYK
jgi:phosphate transport system substrate-binding protein